MSILEKFAKLMSEVEGDNSEFVVNVYDDESEGADETPVMWMTAEKKDVYDDDDDDEENEIEIIYVDIVQFNNDLFFSMPQNRQNSCATSLFKRFIKHYRENFEGIPVAANFQNYDLQEKFKIAIEKGIFPKDSLKFSDFTSKESYDEDTTFNMDNRKLNKLISDIGNNSGDIILSESPTITNIWEAEFVNVSLENLSEFEKLSGKSFEILFTSIDGYNVIFSVNSELNYGEVKFEYNKNTKNIDIPEFAKDYFLDYLTSESHWFYKVFSSTISNMTINNESLQDAIVIAKSKYASRNKRLIKKNK